MKWKLRRGTTICCPLTYSGDYTISHRPRRFTLSFRPPGRHVPLGCYTTLREAKDVAEQHENLLISTS